MEIGPFWKYLALFLIFLVLFVWYLTPLLLIDVAWVKTEGFTLHWPYVAKLGDLVAADKLNLDELPKSLSALLLGVGASVLLFNRRDKSRSAVVFCILIVSFIVLATFLALISYWVLGGLSEQISIEYGKGTGENLVNMCALRFRELLTLFSALLGLGVEQLRHLPGRA